MPVRVTPARRPGDIQVVRGLLRDYFGLLAAEFHLSHPDPATLELPGEYAAPDGAMLLAWDGFGQPVGCVGVRPLEEPGACELKHLFVAPAGRGTGAGRLLLSAALEAAAARYRIMRLDTDPGMAAAIALYRSAGFQPDRPYGEGKAPALLYFSRVLGA